MDGVAFSYMFDEYKSRNLMGVIKVPYELTDPMVEMLKAWIRHKGFRPNQQVTLTGWKKHFGDEWAARQPRGATYVGRAIAIAVTGNDPRVNYLEAFARDGDGIVVSDENHNRYRLARLLQADE